MGRERGRLWEPGGHKRCPICRPVFHFEGRTHPSGTPQGQTYQRHSFGVEFNMIQHFGSQVEQPLLKWQ